MSLKSEIRKSLKLKSIYKMNNQNTVDWWRHNVGMTDVGGVDGPVFLLLRFWKVLRFWKLLRFLKGFAWYR